MEIWKTISEFKDYRISNHGRVMSIKFGREKILKPSTSHGGYYQVLLCKNSKVITFKVHKLVSIAFLNHIPSGYNEVVNHKDLNPKNNNVDNLEIITQRENTNKKHVKSSSKYTGVSRHKVSNKWVAQIRIGDNKKYLGLFLKEYDAHLAYEKALREISPLI